MKDFAKMFVEMRKKLDLYKSSLKIIGLLLDEYRNGKDAEVVVKAIETEYYRTKILEEEEK